MIKIQRCGLAYTDRVVVITGGSKGIGAGCARVFVDAGARVVICARGIETGKKLAEELDAQGHGSCTFIQCDVTKPENVKKTIDKAVNLHGRIDCLINNAGYHPDHKKIDDFSTEEFMHILQTNLISYFVACKYSLTYLRKVKGNIINLSSLVANIGQEAATIYCATKGGITSFTKSLAIEEAQNCVRVNSVSPGNILSNSRTEAARASKDPKVFNRWLDSHQITGRSGTCEEVGQICLFLASDTASYLTGIDLIVSGGSELGFGVKYPLHFI